MAGTDGYEPLPRGARTVSPEQMGEALSEKMSCCSTVRITPNGVYWIAMGLGEWKRLDDLEREVAEWKD